MLRRTNWQYEYEALVEWYWIGRIEPRPAPGFNLSPVVAGFVVGGVALGQVFLIVLRFFPLSVNPPMVRYFIRLPSALYMLSNWQHGYKNTSTSLYCKTRRICVINSRWFMEVKKILTVYSIRNQVTLINQYLAETLGYWPVQEVDIQLSLFITF
jgi:hypothetical protein